MTEKELLISRYKKLAQNKDKTSEEIEQLVEKKISEKELLSNFSGLNDEEKDKALDLYDSYIAENSFEHLAEKNTLIQIVYLEIISERMKKFIDEEEKAKKSIPLSMIEALRDNNNQVIELKEKIGMLTKAEESSFSKTWDLLQKKVEEYYNSHKGCNVVQCPMCNQLFEMRMTTTDLTPEKCRWFRNTLLYHPTVFQLYHDKKITVNEAAEILGVSTYYIEYQYSEIFLKELQHVS